MKAILGSAIVTALLLLCLLQPVVSTQQGYERHLFLNIPGCSGSMSMITNLALFPHCPSTTISATFAAGYDVLAPPSNYADCYGQRLRTWFIAPQNGSYVFRIRANRRASLSMSVLQGEIVPFSTSNVQTVAYNGVSTSSNWYKSNGQGTDEYFGGNVSNGC